MTADRPRSGTVLQGGRPKAYRPMPAADVTALRAAYRRLLRSTHPDVSERRDATARTVELTAAYRLLASLPADAQSGIQSGTVQLRRQETTYASGACDAANWTTPP